ncbi:fumarylacetoacetase [Thalassobacillus devorans]|uniref:Fumarylacetoacetase n=1 Tax=Thalassobacillus devorans TaxID=279813 RepID=A0ABQ1PQD6_9BACI|nr:fumarylacetoacetate hydrolase family protein [Thalassobacillus devorans]NIK30346.1 fumarylacetoacetate (FAA) hydrolase [Thalassobacillus devorans]GGD01000.1 fumarylacetoacetase [Thalassobacillus devorans]
MKYITFRNKQGRIAAGWIDNDVVVDMYEASNGELPIDLVSFLEKEEACRGLVDKLADSLNTEDAGVYRIEEVDLLAPLPRPVSVRDFYAFEEHVKTARAKRGLEVVPEWYGIPVFYFTNHLAIKGPDEEVARPKNSEWLDYELEIACVIGKQGRNIPAAEADDYIFGYCIMNDWSARDLQRQEMKVGLGPAKGKDFATSIGPWLVTKDELIPFQKDRRYDLEMKAAVNGKVLSEGNFETIHYSFAEMIERASADVTLYPGEVIGSGTVGTGCILELGTDVHRWLEPGDEVSLEITGLGKLTNKII